MQVVDGAITFHPLRNHGLTVESGYGRYWLPVLGPTATWAFIYVHRATGAGHRSAIVMASEMAFDLGVPSTKNGPFVGAISRLVQFGLLDPNETNNYLAFTNWPYLSRRQLDRLRPLMAREALDFAADAPDEMRVTASA